MILVEMRKYQPIALQALLLMAVIFAFCGCSPKAEPPKAVSGDIDLSSWDFERDGPVRMFGAWEFRWSAPGDYSLHESITDDGKREYYPVPGLWQGRTQSGRTLSAKGNAVYTLSLQLPDELPEQMSILVAGGMSVCEVRVNGVLAAASGVLGTSVESEKPQRHFVIAELPATGKLMVVSIRVSNYHNVQGGLNGDVLLGSTQQINDFYSTPRLLGACMGGALFCLSLLYIALYYLRRSSVENLYFGLFCMLWCVAILFSPSSGFLMTKLAPGLSWEWYINFAMLPYGATVPLMLMFYHSLFPKSYGKLLEYFYWAVGLLYMAYILITPPNAYDVMLFSYFIVSTSALVYMLVCFALDLVHKEKGTRMLIVGYLALAFAELDDLLFDLNFIDVAALRPFGVFVFILSYAFFFAFRFTRAFSESERLTEELKKAYAVLQENLHLKRELALRQKTEAGLRLMQGRLSKILDSLDDAIIAINQSREIAFCNHPFEEISGQEAKSLLGRPFTSLLSDPKSEQATALSDYLSNEAEHSDQSRSFDDITLSTEDGRTMTVGLLVTDIEIAEESLRLLVVRRENGDAEQQAASLPAALLQELNNNRQRIINLEEAMLSLGSLEEAGQQQVLKDLKALDKLLKRLGSKAAASPKPEDKRRLAANVMQLAVGYWTLATGTTKAELAERSGLWNVYMERDGYFRTQTLDKYLSEETMPLKPRWQKVHVTADFVLANCDAELPVRRELEDAFTALKSAS